MFFVSFIGCVLRRSSRGVKDNIKKVFAVHGMRVTLQSDNGKEFKGSVKRFCRMKKIRMVQSPPYSPRVQGKVEGSHHVLRNNEKREVGSLLPKFTLGERVKIISLWLARELRLPRSQKNFATDVKYFQYF